MNTKQLTYPSIKIQEQFWIDKEAQSDDATPETREADLLHLIDGLYSACNSAYPWLCKAKASQIEKGTVLPRALDVAISNVQNAAMQARAILEKHRRL